MAFDYEKAREDLKEMGSDASDSYHEHIPVSKRPLFWLAFVVVCILVASAVGFLLPG